ncbi:hypothetical protein AYI68_g913 [Smittium mucronatum]|uniref:Uncharacterized protein n=1 Tax=Smittium mucronatum TaxID=133383 RepID=A0A1R0H720_9FUNG|nr:hypothetical protein AYI68_g913 [Smittium mucronatum]
MGPRSRNKKFWKLDQTSSSFLSFFSQPSSVGAGRKNPWGGSKKSFFQLRADDARQTIELGTAKFLDGIRVASLLILKSISRSPSPLNQYPVGTELLGRWSGTGILFALTQQRPYGRITDLLRLSTLRPLLHVLTTLSVCTAPTVGIIGENLTGELGPEPNESPSKEDTRSSITGSPTKLTDGSKS